MWSDFILHKLRCSNPRHPLQNIYQDPLIDITVTISYNNVLILGALINEATPQLFFSGLLSHPYALFVPCQLTCQLNLGR